MSQEESLISLGERVELGFLRERQKNSYVDAVKSRARRLGEVVWL